jgi:hypothetical protein
MTVDHDLAEQFVRENWHALAASAWRFHLQYGRGALILEWTVVKRWSEDPACRFETRYTTRTENVDFNAVISDYDPKTAIVIAFSDSRLDEGRAPRPQKVMPPIKLRPGTALAAMTITAQPSPPDAHRARGH